MVHNWFVSMGMLNFSLSVSLAMFLLVALDRLRVAPSAAHAAAVALLSIAVWYAHQLPLMLVEILVGVHVLAQPGWRARFDRARALLVPLAPATAIARWGRRRRSRRRYGCSTTSGPTGATATRRCRRRASSP
jgi:hypothetical protein